MHKLAIGVLVAALSLAACGGSSKPSASGSGGTTTTGPGGSTAAPSGGEGGSSNDLAKVKIKITYAEGGADAAQAGETTLTIAQDGKGKSSFASSAGGDPSAATMIYSDGTSTISCAGTGATAHCTSIPASTAGSITSGITAGFAGLASVVTTLGGGDKSSEKIAGRDASCVKYKAKDVIGKLASLPFFKDSNTDPADYDGNDTAEICLDKDTGFPLKFSGTKKGVQEDTLTATAVGDPSDSDFTPPVPPETVPSIPNVSIPTVPTNPGQ